MPPNRMVRDARRQSIMLSKVAALWQCEWNGEVLDTLAETSSESNARKGVWCGVRPKLTQLCGKE